MKQIILEKPTKLFQKLSYLPRDKMWDELGKLDSEKGEFKGITREESRVLMHGEQYSISKEDVIDALEIAKIPYCNVCDIDNKWYVCSNEIDNLTDEQLESMEKQNLRIREFTVTSEFRDRSIGFEIPKSIHLQKNTRNGDHQTKDSLQ